jgi:hypothetical protein
MPIQRRRSIGDWLQAHKRGRLRARQCTDGHRPLVRRRIFCLLLVATGAASLAIGSSAGVKALRFDLATASVQGRPLLGKSLSAVTSALGTPDQRSLHKRHGSLSYGKLGPHGPWALTVIFRRRAGALRVVSIAIASPHAREARLGRILRLSPRRTQRAISSAYAGTLRLADPYRCRRAPLRCRGTFTSASGNVKVAFGLLFPGMNSQRYILLYI